MDSKMTQRLLQIADSNQGTFNLADALCHFYHNHGPALELHHLSIEGPLKLVDSLEDKVREKLQQRITGVRKEGQSQEDFTREMLKAFLPRAFRKPVSEETVTSYLDIATRHWDAGHSLDEGLHLLLRNILISPRFLYRCLDANKMDDFDLATRLSYFLAQRPPDATLRDLAQRTRLSPTIPAGPNDERKEYWVLRREAERLISSRVSAPFIQSFVGQWLDTNTLSGIMPDPKFNFDEGDTAMARKETERFFTEILSKNLPMTDFIDPDFTYSSVSFLQRNYGFTPPFAKKKDVKLDSKAKATFRRMEIERGGRYGGLLGQAAILMATANGVDTQPVIRGVWVLENILGTPPPPPPKNVPALTPDTQGATTPRELLTAHTKDAACAGCHQRIDPIGFVLENYDPVGRWRTEWPESKAMIDSSGVLPDGTIIKDAIEFKAWLVENIDLFSECLAEKLMIYATGRVPNYAELRIIQDAACAGCHQRIDPIGFVLENYDPVGRWRTEWPESKAMIDSSGVLPDGTIIKDAIEFKAWLVENIDLFSECLAEKLMIYATGRVPNYAEKREIEEIVERNHENGNGFRDLLLALIESETFRTK